MIGLERCPEDGLAWLALADWLEERGEPDRAELVRLREYLRMWPVGHERGAWEAQLRGLLAAGTQPAGPTATLELAPGVSMTMALIPPGEFMMGSPPTDPNRNPDEAQHRVALTRGFYLGIHPVTQEQWGSVMFDRTGILDGGRRPVSGVSWHQCQEFCRMVSERAGRGVALPTEAQWEYACRAGTSTDYYAGDGEEALKLAGWYRANSGRRAHPVGELVPNAWGLHDMHGNVWEWCADWYGKDYYNAPPKQDPPGPSEGRSRVLRGGSWDDFDRYCRSASRDGVDPSNEYQDCGFRCCMPQALDPPGPSEGCSRVLRGGSWGDFSRYCRSASRNWNEPVVRVRYYGFRCCMPQILDPLGPNEGRGRMLRGGSEASYLGSCRSANRAWLGLDTCVGRVGFRCCMLQVLDPPGPSGGRGHVLRGGGWCSNGRYCRSAIRYGYEPVDWGGICGFRLAVASIS